MGYWPGGEDFRMSCPGRFPSRAGIVVRVGIIFSLYFNINFRVMCGCQQEGFHCASYFSPNRLTDSDVGMQDLKLKQLKQTPLLEFGKF
jgi:hypothetical protein